MSRIPVIIDTDPGVDDTLALSVVFPIITKSSAKPKPFHSLLALASPELEVLAIIVSYGNTDADASYRNVLKIYDVLSRHLKQFPEERANWPNFEPERKTILARGADRPLEGEVHSAQYFHGRDGLGDITKHFPSLDLDDNTSNRSDHPQLQLTDKPGVDVALDIINSQLSQSVTYIALGPLTTLAQVVQKGGSAFAGRIGKVVCMGGALDVPGNTSAVAEFNFFADPYAVNYLLTPPHGVAPPLPFEKFILLPLDITTPHELPFPYYAQHIDCSFEQQTSQEQPKKKLEQSPLVYFTSAFLSRTREVMLQFGKDAMELHDITAVWCAIENSPLASGASLKLKDGWDVIRRQFQIERTGELTRGMLVVDRRDDVGAYAPGANRAQVQAELERFHAHTEGILESTAVPAQVDVEDESQAVPPSARVAAVGTGVPIITSTPGPDVLLKLLAERVWGVGRSL